MARRKKVILLCAAHASLLLCSFATADESGDLLQKACPEALREHEQLLLSHPAPKDASTFTRPALRKDLLQMLDEDQNARKELMAAMNGSEDLPDNSPSRQYTRQVDARNLRRLKHIIAQDGVPTISMVGVSGVEAVFVLT